MFCELDHLVQAKRLKIYEICNRVKAQSQLSLCLSWHCTTATMSLQHQIRSREVYHWNPGRIAGKSVIPPGASQKGKQREAYSTKRPYSENLDDTGSINTSRL